MNWIDLFIRRPILTWMVSLSLIVFGVLGFVRLGVNAYPDMEFPVVGVTGLLEGASPEVMEEDVTDPLEEHLNTIEGVRRLSSQSRQGRTSISVEFVLGTDLDAATQDVRDRVERARFDLPEEMEPPVVSKFDFGGFPIMWVPLLSPRPQSEASEFVKHQVKPLVETITGVAGIEVFGELNREIRIWLDGNALRARGLAATDVITSLRREHIERPGGVVEGGMVEFSVKTDAEYRTVDELADMVLAFENGAPIRLRDVARVEDGVEDQRYYSRYDGGPAVGIGVVKTSDGNTVAVADEVRRRLAKIQETLPEDMRFKEGDGVADFSRSVRESVEEAIFSLWFGALLATLTVFVFLRRFRPTLVVALAIPFSLITTFSVMWMLDYTLNSMTLLALTLAVGVVIDDAIVVLENIERHRDLGEEPHVAASKGAREVAFAATAATVSIAVVFLPVIFVDGLVGNFLGEFGATVAAAVMISLFVALTLTPMLAARIPPPKKRAHGSIYDTFERWLDALERGYRKMLGWSVEHRAVTLLVATLTFFAAFGLAGQLGAEFFPSSDEGRMFITIETPPGTSPEGTLEMLKRAEDWVLSQPEVAGAFAGAGTGGSSSGSDPTRGIMFVMFKNRAERERSAQEIVREAREVLSEIPGMKVRVSDMSGFGGSSDSSDMEVELQGNVELSTLDQLGEKLIDELRARGGYVGLNKSLKLGSPEVRVIPDREKAASLGVDADQLASTVQAMIGGLRVGTFKEAGNRYDIRMRLEQEDRDDPQSILGLYVRTRTGDVIELRNLVKIEKTAAPSTITRTNRQRSVKISANLEGKDLGKALAEAHAIAADILPEDVRLIASGGSEEFLASFQELGFAMVLAILVIYMILAAQFESLVHPLTVMFALPLAMVGAYGGLFLRGMTLNIFSMIGIILLFGLATKNSILLVDYANQLREQGMDKVTAMTTAAPIRMRPVLMTALSMIFGVAPAALGIGPGSESRAPMAVATGAGMISSTALTLLIVPVFYLVLDDGLEWLRAKLHRKPKAPLPPVTV
ncbi:MAG: efflux RND transporter permease subunit [bacterium]|nr:efflux RND transporter permease subunit [bacterium]MCP5066880.1 efflux RND transporter permease subunit [bacterium]